MRKTRWRAIMGEWVPNESGVGGVFIDGNMIEFKARAEKTAIKRAKRISALYGLSYAWWARVYDK